MKFTVEQRRVMELEFVLTLHKDPHIWKFDAMINRLEEKLNEDNFVECVECNFSHYLCERVATSCGRICPNCFENNNK